MKVATKVVLCVAAVASTAVVEGFAPPSASNHQLQKNISPSSSELHFFGGGSASKSDLDEEVSMIHEGGEWHSCISVHNIIMRA